MDANLVSLSFDNFFELFRPIKNHLDDNAAQEGCMFETYGEELHYIHEFAKENSDRVWTLMEDDDGNLCIVNGFHLVNRLGYILTEEKFDEKIEYYVYDEEDMFDSLEDLP
jgi:hypothetical protein